MSATSQNRIRFGDFEADLATGELYRNDVRISLQQKPFELLAILLQSPGELVTRTDLQNRLWPDTFVQRDLSLNTAMRKLRQALGESGKQQSYIETVGSRGYRFIAPVIAPALPPKAPIRHQRFRLAVLPFENLNGDEHDYLGDGLTEQLIAQLGRMNRHLAVLAPVSSMQYKRTTKTTTQICQELRCDYILSGSVIFAGGQARVTAKLIRAGDQTCIWAESYARDERDIFSIQDEITHQIARAILRALPASHATYSAPSITTTQTYEKYLKACFYANRFAEQGFQRAEALFEEVIAEDSNFAPGFGAYALMLSAMTQHGGIRPKVAFERVRSLVESALALDPNQEQALVALSFSHTLFYADFEAAEASWRRLLNLNSSAVMGYYGYSQLMTILGRHDEAINAQQRAVDIDPLNTFVKVMYACAFYFARRFEEAANYCQDAIDSNPAFPIAHATMSWIQNALGNHQGAIAACSCALELAPGAPLMLGHYAYSLAAGGHKSQAEHILAQMQAMSTEYYVPPYWVALVHLALGNNDHALDWLERSFDERCGWRLLCNVDSRLDPLADQPRFRSLIHRLGFKSR